ncbi:MAG: M13 family metallopeptidase [Bacteroidota bacterium]|nr:M13 family metallopeptidase [Bacteroidota bacterium]
MCKRINFFFLIACIAIASCNQSKTKTTKPDVLAANIDSSVNPADDFFDYANGNWIKKHPIPADESAWGLFQEIPNETLQRLKDINEEMAKTKPANGTAEQKIGDFWKAANDTAKIERLGTKPLQPYLAKIDSIHDAASLQTVMAQLDAMGVGGVVQMFVSQDAKNSTDQVLQLWQTGLGLPEREFYFKMDSTSVALRNAYTKNITQILVLLGEDSAKGNASAKNILSLETSLAKESKKLEDLRDPYANYHKYAVKDLYKVSPQIDWANYMAIYGVGKTDSVIIGQPAYYKEAGAMLHSASIDTWKNYLRYRLANAFAPALPDAFSKADFEFNKLFSGATERRARWKRIIGNEQNVMGELLGQIYVKKYFDDSAKARYTKLVENIRTALKNRIENLQWMSDSTKQKALAKLAVVNKKVGYPDKWKDFSSLQIMPDNYFQNLVNANLFWHNFNINKLGRPVDKTEWGMYPQTYNAYYDPSNNEIVLPAAAFIIPGYSDSELDDAVVYGYMAASTIGHEMTHGFDDEGRQFDAQGNLKEWWTAQDSAKFAQRAKVLADQFSNFIAIDTFKINGKATLGENIADLGGVLLGYDAFKLTDEYKKGEKIGGYTPTQRFFLGYALSWLENQRPQSLRTEVLTDVHSPAKYRVLGPLTNVDEFYKAFNVKPVNKMYTPDSLRARIW